MDNTNMFMIIYTILLFVQINSISTQDFHPRGRLLTPEEGCGISKVAYTKIVGGTDAKPGAFPWIALIADINEKEKKVYINCGGSLITSHHILTAAHCVRSNGTYVARIGEHDTTTASDGEHLNIGVIRVDRHPNHNSVDEKGDGQNDIAVLTLARDVEFNDRIRPICLPLTKELLNKSFVDDNPFVAGWGKVEELGNRSKVLRQVQVPVIDNEQCREVYEKKLSQFSNGQFDDMVLCAGNLAGGHGTCHGDSGGPLMLPILENGEFPMYQIGIVSYSFGCGRPNVPSVYTRVSKFIDWIQEKVNHKL